MTDTKPARKTSRRTTAPKAKGPGLDELKFMVESAFERRTMLTPDEIDGSTRPTVERVIAGLEKGEFRVAEPDGKGGWAVNEWLKKAVLLYFRVNDMQVVDARPAPFWDRSRRASRATPRATSASSAHASSPARSRAAARTSARTSC